MQNFFHPTFLDTKTAIYHGLFKVGFYYGFHQRYFERLGLNPFINNLLTTVRLEKGTRVQIKQLHNNVFPECGSSRFETLMVKAGVRPATALNSFAALVPFSQFVKLEHSDAFVKQQSIKNNILISSYRGLRHTTNLPIRGQRTHTNAKTRRKRKVV